MTPVPAWHIGFIILFVFCATILSAQDQILEDLHLGWQNEEEKQQSS
jgi:hypothetical protein